jgi:Domain of unknown function (DUF4430)
VTFRLVAPVVVAASLAGCGNVGGHGTATIWITRDRGTHVLLQRTVPAGLTAMQGLDRVAHIKTRYSGRFVQAIDGVEGSLTARRDWFYFINGYEADRSAAEYRLHAGDVEWWDYRSWKTKMEQPVVVGAFPEPFVHGYNGKRRAAFVVYFTRAQRADARAIARVVHGRAIENLFDPQTVDGNLLVLAQRRRPGFSATTRGGAGGPVAFVYAGDPRLLLRRPPVGHLRYEVGT